MPRRSPTALQEMIRDFRRDQIIQVAQQLFGERGTVEVPMDEIAAKAGVARSTVYVYFTNRDELLRACLQRMYEQLETGLNEESSAHLTPALRLRAVIRGLLERIDENPAFFRVAMAIQTIGDRPGAEAVDTELMLIGLHVAQRFMDLVEEGVTDGSFRTVDPERAAAFIGQQALGALIVRAAEPAPPPLDDAADQICELLLSGLANR